MRNIGKVIEDYNPKYKDIELIVAYNWLETEILGKFKWKEVKKDYGKRMILSVKDHDYFKITSIIIDGE